MTVNAADREGGVVGNQELDAVELEALLSGELPAVLPLEGWRAMTLHCQMDAIGPSDRHPDLVKLEVSFPPVAEQPATPPCPECKGSRVAPNRNARWDTSPAPVPCPMCTACTATVLHALAGRVRCSLEAGHYDEANQPLTESKKEPGGWHQSLLDRTNFQLVWCDTADAATPHRA